MSRSDQQFSLLTPIFHYNKRANARTTKTNVRAKKRTRARTTECTNERPSPCGSPALLLVVLGLMWVHRGFLYLFFSFCDWRLWFILRWTYVLVPLPQHHVQLTLRDCPSRYSVLLPEPLHDVQRTWQRRKTIIFDTSTPLNYQKLLEGRLDWVSLNQNEINRISQS